MRRVRDRAGPLVFAAAFLLAFPAAASAETVRQVPQSRAEVMLSYAPVVKRAAPAVVNIYTKRRVQRSVSPFMNDPIFRRFFGDRFSFGMPRERVESSLGSGVIVAEDGLIVTNNHVIEGGETFTVALADRREFEAELLLADERTDLAVLRIDAGGERLPFLPFSDSDMVEVGDIVLAIGNPFGVGQTVTSGIVSALARTQVGVSDYQFFIQTDAAINPGNSGGALITMDGRLIGINTAIFSRTGGSIGIGFAIPANMVRLIADSAGEGGQVKRPWFGAKVQVVDSDLADSLGLDRPGGSLVQSVYEGGPADRAGLRVGDVIHEVDGRDVADPQALRYRFATQGLGGTTEIGFMRDGRMRSVQVPLERPPEVPPRDLTVLEGAHPLAGATVGNLSPAFADELRLDTTDSGVVVAALERGSPASRLGLRRGDVIAEVGSRPIASVDELEAVLRSGGPSWTLVIRRGDRTFSAQVRS